jgi:post-segregation antitoxin (ccd killing protein)
VSVTLNADLYAKAKGAGINLSRVAEKALADALAQHLAEQARAEIRQDLRALDAFVEAHGSFAEMVREHYATVDGDTPV